jgi:hypothetical protein
MLITFLFRNFGRNWVVKVGTGIEEGLGMKFYEYSDQLLCVIKEGTLFVT